ncbi:MAG: hypothetical protein O0X93_00970 [Methanocorpusculum sp.]|nr:hypothetical protein [Methanocorpusculum sp.]MDE2521716.1 hypothetical protein [Methanocorpusculum sp.]MDE2525345.1 hypothetical protein [Methanocorpusculum sp.]
MKKKIFICIGILIFVVFATVIGGFTLAYADAWIRVQPLSHIPGSNSIIVSVTDDDLARYPALQNSLETSESIIVTENPFTRMKYGKRCVNKSEAIRIENEFGEMYRENGSIVSKSRYLKWDDAYYRVYPVYS